MALLNYTIKTMTPAELEIAIDWAAAEGWNPGLHDLDCFYATDPRGFLMGYLDGEPIASISVVKYGETFGFLGFYIVKPEFRGQGYGFQLWQAGLDYLKGRNIGLDGVVDQQANYLKSGFQLAYRNIRYEGIGGEVDGNLAFASDDQANLVPLISMPTCTVLEYDRAFFPDARTAFLESWLSQSAHQGLGLLHHGKLSGYGVLRPCRLGYKIGPLFADTPEFAQAIFLALVTQVEQGQPFYLDIPEVNPAALALVNRYGMKSMFETARMYQPSIPNLPVEQIFGVTTFELG